MMPPMQLTETPPTQEVSHLLRADVEVDSLTIDDRIILRTRDTERWIWPISIFHRRDCHPRPGDTLSLDIQIWDNSETQFWYVASVNDRVRFSHLVDNHDRPD